MVNRRTRKFLKNCETIIDSMYQQSFNLKNEDKYDSVKLNLQTHLKRHYDNFSVHFYGSRVIGLAENNSDLDIFIEIGNLSLIQKFCHNSFSFS